MVGDLIERPNLIPTRGDAGDELVDRRTRDEERPEAGSAQMHTRQRNRRATSARSTACSGQASGVVEACAWDAGGESAPSRPGRVMHPASADTHRDVALAKV